MAVGESPRLYMTLSERFKTSSIPQIQYKQLKAYTFICVVFAMVKSSRHLGFLLNSNWRNYLIWKV